VQVQRALRDFERRGAQLVAVGQGSEEEAAHYCGQYASGFPCLGDPSRASYELLGLKRGGWWSIVVKPFLTDTRESLRLIRDADLEASRLESTDVLQLGGVAIVDREGVLRFLHVAESTDDMPSNDEILAALDTLSQ
jgi:peroxiredoxin